VAQQRVDLTSGDHSFELVAGRIKRLGGEPAVCQQGGELATPVPMGEIRAGHLLQLLDDALAVGGLTEVQQPIDRNKRGSLIVVEESSSRRVSPPFIDARAAMTWGEQRVGAILVLGSQHSALGPERCWRGCHLGGTLAEMNRMEHSWEANVRQLYRAFQRADEEKDLLRQIDLAIIRSRDATARPIEEVFTNSLARFSEIYGLSWPGVCYVYAPPSLQRVDAASDHQRTVWPTQLRAHEVVERLVAIDDDDPLDNHRTVVFSRADGLAGLFPELPDANAVALHPIMASSGDLFAVVMFADRAAPEGSVFGEGEFHSSLSGMAGQLRIAYEQWQRTEQVIRAESLWELFASLQLAPDDGFRGLASSVRDAFPTFGPLKIPSEHRPEVQILVVPGATESPRALIIRGSTGSESSITNIDVYDSIVGLLITDRDVPYFYDDPRKPTYKDIYKSYLGNGAEIKTEFAVRLVTPDARLVGILNIESTLSDAFTVHHRTAIQQFASRIAPMVDLFEQRLDQNSVMQRSAVSATSTYLDSVAGIFGHAIGTPLLALKLTVEGSQKLAAEVGVDVSGAEGAEAPLSRLTRSLVRLDATRKQIDDYTQDFLREMSGFGDVGWFNLRELVDATVRLAKHSVLEPDEPIRIDVSGNEHAPAFCGPLLKQHLYSLFTNAIYSLRESGAEAPGSIRVSIAPDVPTDDAQEQALNERWAIAVRDNGPGVTLPQLTKLREFRDRTSFRQDSRGQGLGLLALQQYVSSIGGSVSLDSEEGKFFEVRVLVAKYHEAIHDPLSTTLERSVDGARRR
jgi:signal transduction histidine kinase